MTEQLEIVLSNIKTNKRVPKSLHVQKLDRVMGRAQRTLDEQKYRMWKLKRKDGEPIDPSLRPHFFH
jgi:hypothetical protein